MTTTTHPAAAVVPAAAARVPISVRGAQLVLLLPLGLLQAVAVIAFSISLGWHGPRDATVALWAAVMAPCCAVTAVALTRRRLLALRAALVLLAAQAGFSTVKLAVYHESASFVFFGFVALTAGLLVLPTSRRYLLGRAGITPATHG